MLCLCDAHADQPTALDLLYYLLYWFIVLGLVLYKWWRGTLTDRQEAQIDDLKSFALHAGERLDTEAGLGEEWAHAGFPEVIGGVVCRSIAELSLVQHSGCIEAIWEIDWHS
jgi:hypothetical protein